MSLDEDGTKRCFVSITYFEEDINQVTASLLRFLFTNPILLRNKGPILFIPHCIQLVLNVNTVLTAIPHNLHVIPRYWCFGWWLPFAKNVYVKTLRSLARDFLCFQNQYKCKHKIHILKRCIKYFAL